MMRMVAVAVAVLCGCGSTEWSTPEYHVPAGTIEVAPPRFADMAFSIAADTYQRLSGVDLREVGVEIHWTASEFPCQDGQTCLGLTSHTPGHGCQSSIWIGTEAPYIPLVFAHELAHCARWAATGDGDSGHADATWWNHSDGYQVIAHVAYSTAIDRAIRP